MGRGAVLGSMTFLLFPLFMEPKIGGGGMQRGQSVMAMCKSLFPINDFWDCTIQQIVRQIYFWYHLFCLNECCELPNWLNHPRKKELIR